MKVGMLLILHIIYLIPRHSPSNAISYSILTN